MIQVQISLPEELNQQIKERAKLLQESEEQVIRDLLSLGLAVGLVKLSRRHWRNGEEALRTLGELNIKGPADLAMRHDDEYLD